MVVKFIDHLASDRKTSCMEDANSLQRTIGFEQTKSWQMEYNVRKYEVAYFGRKNKRTII